MLYFKLFESAGPNSLLVIEMILSIIAALTFTRFIFYAKKHAKCFGNNLKKGSWTTAFILDLNINVIIFTINFRFKRFIRLD